AALPRAARPRPVGRRARPPRRRPQGTHPPAARPAARLDRHPRRAGAARRVVPRLVGTDPPGREHGPRRAYGRRHDVSEPKARAGVTRRNGPDEASGGHGVSARDDILARIGTTPGDPAAEYAAIERRYLRRHHDTDLVELFAERVADYRAIVHRVSAAG